MKLKYFKDNARQEKVIQEIEELMRKHNVTIEHRHDGLSVSFYNVEGTRTNYLLGDVESGYPQVSLTFPRTVESEKLIIEY